MFGQSEFGKSSICLNSQLESELFHSLSIEEREKWSILALELICFVFPRPALWDSTLYASMAHSLVPLLNHVLRAITLSSIPRSTRGEVSEALLAASQASNQVRQAVLPTVAELVDDRSPFHLQAELAHQQSISSRLSAQFDRSERFIHDFCCHCGNYDKTCITKFYRQLNFDQVNPKLNTLYGRLHRSHLENLVQCENYSSAIEEVDNWRVPEPFSQLEGHLLPSMTITVCKIFRSQGLFLEARERLESCLRTLDP